jgi:IclR family mhp operon transcriptional activator
MVTSEIHERDTDSRGNIRSIGRGLHVLRTINLHGRLCVMEISRLCHLPYRTAYRIVETLLEEQVIEREEDGKYYRAAAYALALSTGYQDVNKFVAASRPHILQLTEGLGWPVSLCRRVGMSMMVYESTRATLKPTIRSYQPGDTMPILGSASGKTHLAFCSQEERAAILSALRDHDMFGRGREIDEAAAECDAIRTAGYATWAWSGRAGKQDRSSMISLPVHIQGDFKGTVTLAFATGALTMVYAVATFLPALKRAVGAIEEDLTAGYATS